MTGMEVKHLKNAAAILDRDFPGDINKHYPRLKRAFKRGGFPAVNEYMKSVTNKKGK